ncbi:phospholipase A [Pasteurella multocida]|uniref:phospholipase A n=1 Tax=Pasteurella multocida TaxID=747 RepID=UPI00147CAAB7|nr:phospholipase A [Pasteurella multocida]NNI31608.1 phospholipase A [Pasteurella multocida]NNI61947.1 phospholipase A [Pasteurella multocida]NNI77125.1 phospholipase A [Pasteurella multocida]HDR1496133.1 phospholipase A [Pasteurella multocida]HDR1844825.1 phospholipase A [Pasteurella multocida]
MYKAKGINLYKKCLILAVLGVFVSHGTQANESDTRPYKSKAEVLLTKSDAFIGLLGYEENYLMGTYSNRHFLKREKTQKDEIKFKISLALPLWRGILGNNSVLAASYTQKSWFQLSNVDDSSPFRETNYEPQLFLAWKTQYSLPFGWTLQDVETGINHQSNGRDDAEKLSRSWNRLYVRASAIKQNWTVEIKPWWRIPEKAKNDDNPDITKYRGHFDIALGYYYHDHQFKLSGHYNPISNKGGLEASYSYPITKNIRFYTQYYNGYGESLIDYQQRIQRIGIGISLNNVF